MKVILSAAEASRRHPEETTLILNKINKSLLRKDPSSTLLQMSDLSWCYDLAVKIDGSCSNELSNLLRGRDRLADRVDHYFISLQGTAGRRHASTPFDNRKLLAGPDENLPVELLGVPSLTLQSGPSVWIWQPSSPTSPGYAEYLIQKVIPAPMKNDPKGLLIDLQRDNEIHSFWSDGKESFYDRYTSEYGQAFRKFGKQTSLDIPSWFESRGTKNTWDVCVVEASIENLLGLLPDLMAFTMTPHGVKAEHPSSIPGNDDEESKAPSPGPNARRFAFNESLPSNDIKALFSLKPTRPAVMNAAVFFNSLTTESVRQDRNAEDVYKQALFAVAQGISVSDAVAEGQSKLQPASKNQIKTSFRM